MAPKRSIEDLQRAYEDADLRASVLNKVLGEAEQYIAKLQEAHNEACARVVDTYAELRNAVANSRH